MVSESNLADLFSIVLNMRSDEFIIDYDIQYTAGFKLINNYKQIKQSLNQNQIIQFLQDYSLLRIKNSNK